MQWARRYQRRARAEAQCVCAMRDTAGVPLPRIAWIATVVACVITAATLLASGYQGYAAVAAAVGVAAAINLG